MPTAIQPRLFEGPGGGLIAHVDPRHVADNAWADGRNIRFPSGGTYVEKTDGYQFVDGVPDGEPIRALWDYQSTTDRTRHRLVQITLTGAWHGLGTDRENMNDTDPPPATRQDVVTIDQYKNKLIWADGLRVLQWDGALLAGTLGPQGVPDDKKAPTAKIVEIHKDHVLLANITKPQVQPWKVAWSARGNANEWGAGNVDPLVAETAGDIDFIDDPTDITACKVLGDYAIVHKPSRIYRMIFVGGENQYEVEGIPADDGSISARAAISIGSYQYFMGRQNFYRLASFSEPIGDQIWRLIEPTIDWERARQIYAYRRQEYDEVCWKIRQIDGATDLTAVYNIRSQTWSLTDHDPGTCFTEVDRTMLPTVPQGVHSLPVLGIFGQASGAIQVYGGRNANALPIRAWVRSKHFQTGLLPSKILAVPTYATGEGTLKVSVRAAMDARQPLGNFDPARTQPLVLDPAQHRPWVDVREYGRIWQVQFETTELDEMWRLDAYGAAIIPGGYAR